MAENKPAWALWAKRIALLHPLLSFVILSAPVVGYCLEAKGPAAPAFLWLTVNVWGGWLLAVHAVSIEAAPAAKIGLDRYLPAAATTAIVACSIGLAGGNISGDGGVSSVVAGLGIEGWIVGGIAWFAIAARTTFSFETAIAAVSGRPLYLGPYSAYRVFPPPLAVVFDGGDLRRVAEHV